MAAFVYALPEHTTLQQEAAIARGLRGLFPDIDFDRRKGGFLTGDIIPIAGRTDSDQPDAIVMAEPSRLLVNEVRTAFAGLLVEALAARAYEGCGQSQEPPAVTTA